jgi:hypothetical protein
MNNEYGTSGISLHDFNNIGGCRSRRFLNVKDEDDDSELLRKLSGNGLIVTTVTGATPCFA